VVETLVLLVTLLLRATSVIAASALLLAVTAAVPASLVPTSDSNLETNSLIAVLAGLLPEGGILEILLPNATAARLFPTALVCAMVGEC
jgi:hypothetical protein